MFSGAAEERLAASVPGAQPEGRCSAGQLRPTLVAGNGMNESRESETLWNLTEGAPSLSPQMFGWRPCLRHLEILVRGKQPQPGAEHVRMKNVANVLPSLRPGLNPRTTLRQVIDGAGGLWRCLPN